MNFLFFVNKVEAKVPNSQILMYRRVLLYAVLTTPRICYGMGVRVRHGSAYCTVLDVRRCIHIDTETILTFSA